MISDANKNILNTKRTVLEQDLTHTIAEILTNGISVSAGTAFKLDSSITGVRDSLHNVQMIIINKWFRELLLVAKAGRSELRISDVLMCIEDNIDKADWVKLYTVAIIPYIKKNNILG